MTEVTRWGEAGHSYGDTWMEPTDDGDWVLWGDYEALAKELETCKKYRDAYEKCDQIATQRVRELEAERDRLAAENARLRDAVALVRAEMNTQINGGAGWMARFEEIVKEDDND